MIVIIMGVAGSGKTTIGKQLAARLGCGFSDADEFHSEANKQKMARGIALDDEDRQPWLEAMRDAIKAQRKQGHDWVFACSALKRRYRQLLSGGDEQVMWVYLDGSEDLLLERLTKRAGHFFDPRLLRSQLQTLEAPREDEAIRVDITPSPEEIVETLMKRLSRAEASG
ncbi:gluconate kinase [Stutzerimonas stutzeri]|uniref:Gluconokinase n=1 Tax=Stutzerimonas stutzeri TaxID=316 RepID=W8RQD4_STUST|nr:gluconokinase [Stutzerimonas stutzeri]AHL74251.1 gluconate kinase [Stutzerimonas stutzeri]MCQ4330740.1 gluconokinase [Stutzerimonas stutzeri]